MPARPRTLVPFVVLACATALAATSCSAADDGGSGATTPAPTVTVTETAPASPAHSAASAPVTSSPRVPQGADGTCTHSQLRVRYADDPGGAGAGSVTGTFTFTNDSDSSCTLSGFPGVSYVAGSKGDQVGQAASRTDDATSTRTLEPGGSATAALRRSQPGSYGSDCQKTDVKGFRVYAPGGTGAFFVSFPTTGCRSISAPLLQVGPVR